MLLALSESLEGIVPNISPFRAYFGILIALNYKYILLGSLCYDAIKLLIEMFVV